MSILKRQVLFMLFAFAATLCAFAQNKTITGLVVDGNGESIIGASVLVKGTTNGIITDIDGKFTLNDVPEAGVIQISYIGYKTQEISVKNKTNLKVVLVEDNEMLDEVVVVGYGVQKKSDVTGAMIRVGSEELNSRPVANCYNYILFICTSRYIGSNNVCNSRRACTSKCTNSNSSKCSYTRKKHSNWI